VRTDCARQAPVNTRSGIATANHAINRLVRGVLILTFDYRWQLPLTRTLLDGSHRSQGTARLFLQKNYRLNFRPRGQSPALSSLRGPAGSDRRRQSNLDPLRLLPRTPALGRRPFGGGNDGHASWDNLSNFLDRTVEHDCG